MSTGLDWLLPGTRRPAVDEVLFLPGEGFAVHELDRMRDEGLLRRVLSQVHVAADLPDDGAARARAAAALVTRAAAALVMKDGVLGHLSAAWVHGAIDVAPVVVDVLRDRAVWLPSTSCVRVHAARLSPADVHRVAGVEVTSPLRTATDLARWLSPLESTPLLVRLLSDHHLQPSAVLHRLAQMDRPPHARRARVVLHQLVQAQARTCLSSGQDALSGHPVGVEDALHPPHRRDHVAEVLRLAHLEGELGDGHPVT